MAARNVLVVEDDETIRKLLIDILRQHSSLNVDGARDGRDALHQISTKRYSVVVLDVVMPFMSGIDFLDSLQALISDPSLESIEPPAVIVITSIPQEEIPSDDITGRFPTIVRDVLRKPVDAHALAREVESLL